MSGVRIRRIVVPEGGWGSWSSAVVFALLVVSGCGDTRYSGLSAANPTGSPLIATTGLVLSFDMTTTTPEGTLRDFGPVGNHGVLLGTSVTPAVVSGGRQFHTAADRIHLPENSSLAIDGPITIILWLRLDSLGLHQHILACDDKFALWVTPENKVRFSDTLGHGVDSAEPVEAARWYALAAVFDGTSGSELTRDTGRLYLDGSQIPVELVNRTNDTPLRWVPGQLYPSDACYIGFESHQGNEAHQELRFAGSLDELLIFNRALSDEEIRVHANVSPEGT